MSRLCSRVPDGCGLWGDLGSAQFSSSCAEWRRTALLLNKTESTTTAHPNIDVLSAEVTSSYAYLCTGPIQSAFIIPSPVLQELQLASLDSRPRRRVAGRHRIVDVDQNTRVRGLERAGERDLVLWAEGTGAARDGELGTRNVELGTAGASSRVKTDMLGTQQVVAVCKALGDGHGDRLGA